MARPGHFFIDEHGVIREKFFDAKYRVRYSGNNVIGKLFPELGQEVTNTVEAPHLQLALEQSDRTASPGGRITLVAEVRLPAGVHVYAPGTEGYQPIRLQIEPTPVVQLKEAVYPQPEVLELPAIQERVPVFDGIFRIKQDVRVSSARVFSSSLGAEGKTFAITGKLEYQACDDKTCFPPSSVPVEWQFLALPLDRQRAPEDIQHK